MPISGIGSYAPTMQEFINHWTNVNASLGATPLTLRGGYTLANFTTDRTNILNAINTVINADNTAQTTAAAVISARAAMLDRAVQFRKWVQSYLPSTGYAAALPTAPPIKAAESKFLDPLQDILNLWGNINGDAALTGVPLPLTLTGGYALANFTTDLNSIRGAFVTAKNASEQASFVRKQRDLLLPPAEQRMKQYRGVIEARFAGSAFEASLPALSPPPGSTPDPVFVTGGWIAAASHVELKWEPSTNAKLLHYDVRGCSGTTYKVANEFSIDVVEPGEVQWAGTGGVPYPSAQCVYRVYVVLKTGNERGSNDVLVTRP
jgi:hypothetical protein